MQRFGDAVDAAAMDFALSEHPREAAGVVVRRGEGFAYVPVANISSSPTDSFRLPAAAFWRHGEVVGVVHSHDVTRFSPWPSATDMAQQIATNVDWGIVATDGKRAAKPTWWGDFRLDEELVGREYQPGITDCYALIRAAFWQRRGIKLPDIPRDPEWWRAPGANLILDRVSNAGGIEVTEPEVGDVVLLGFKGVPAHLAYLEEGGVILHHAINELSRRETFGRYREMASTIRYFRHTG